MEQLNWSVRGYLLLLVLLLQAEKMRLPAAISVSIFLTIAH